MTDPAEEARRTHEALMEAGRRAYGPPAAPAPTSPTAVGDEGRRKLDDRQKLDVLTPVPKRTSSLHLRIDTHALARWRAAAKAEHCGLSELVRAVMDRYLNAKEFRK